MGMITKPKISIITPCFNAVEYIEQTILSIINQGYSNLEYIIMDGGSTDGTVDIIKKYEDQVTYWISEPDKGQSHAINKGIEKATGDVFNWVNADDYLEEGVLQKVGEYFTNSSTHLLCAKTTFIRPDGSTYENRATPFDEGVFKMLNSRGLNQMGMFWSLNRVKQLKGVNTNFNFAMDLDLWKRYVMTFGLDGIVKGEFIVGYFRLLETSKTGIDMAVNASFFDEENNAALVQYAHELGKGYVESVKLLYPNYKKDLANKKVHTELPLRVLKKWFLELFYEKAKRFFYGTDFKNAFSLINVMPLSDYSGEELKNLKSFKRWSILKKWF